MDDARRIDVNDLGMVVTNVGSWAFDVSTRRAGLVYPRGTDHTVVYASGLWFGARVGGEVRAVVCDYTTEYAPGSIGPDGMPDDPDHPHHQVYKVRGWSGVPADTAHVEGSSSDPLADLLEHHSWSEYMWGAVPHGAPWRLWRLPGGVVGDSAVWVEVPGPDGFGDRMLWSVYNDADPARHTNVCGSSLPLGLEIRQTTFAYDRDGSLGGTVFMRFEIVHPEIALPPPGTAFGDTLEGMYVSLWVDPDLGGSMDDLVGCDTTRALGYCYNATNSDAVYGSTPPAAGCTFLLGPRTAGGGTLGMTAFSKYVSGTDPGSPEQTYDNMQGLLAGGSVLVDPTTGAPTTFFHPGDPVMGSGWLDLNAADKRMMLSAGPFTMAPGDTQVVWAAVIVARGGNRLSSVSWLRYYDDMVQASFEAGPPRLVDTRVDEPAAPVLALAGLRPNPAGDGAVLCFTLSRRSPATLEMVDVSGRRVLSRDVGALGPGRHTLRIDEHGRVPSGVYFLRLSQDGDVATARGVVVH